MKKILLVLMISSMILSFSACSTKDNAADAPEAEMTETAAEEKAAESETDVQEEADETKAEADETKTVYWATKDKESSDVAYHTKDCTIIKDKDPEELPWEIINTLGMPACEICKP